jgi:DNA polymerase-3 subunit gamma/tau
MGLAKVYRPESLEEVEGNEKIVRQLEVMLKKDREDIPHAILFSGPKGCGKTTLGRIIAKELGCEDSDFCEVDSADFRGIDTIRDIRRNMHYACLGDSRVWMLDECHMLSKDAQNALLKALEEPPDHVYFILCTTEPEKLLDTIRSRCKAGWFEVQPLELTEMEEFLRSIVKAEKKSVPKEVIKQIARDSMGSCRDALGVLDKIIDLDEDEMLEAAEQEAARENAVIDLCRALMRKDKWPVIAAIIRNLDKEDPEKTRLAILGYCSSILLSEKTKDAPQAYVVMDCFRQPLWNNGRAGLVMCAYDVIG